MSRAYNIAVTVQGVAPERCERVKSAATQEWPDFDSWTSEESAGGTLFLSASGDGNLCGGEGEEEFTDRLALAIWQAHGSYCCVEVAATYIEELPYETHVRDEDDYETWKATKTPTEEEPGP